MNRIERERALERYMSGEMNAAEESDFFIQVALEKELRQELKAQRVIETALRKDLESEPTEHTAMRARVASMLVETPAAARPMAAMAPPVAAMRPSRPARRRWLVGPLQWVAASAFALALTVGTVIVLPSGKPAENVAPATAPTTQGSHGASGRQGAPAIRLDRNTPPTEDVAPAPLPARGNAPTVGNVRPRTEAQSLESQATPIARASTARGARSQRPAASSRNDRAVEFAAARHEKSTTPSAATHEEPLRVGITIQIPRRPDQK